MQRREQHQLQLTHDPMDMHHMQLDQVEFGMYQQGMMDMQLCLYRYQLQMYQQRIEHIQFVQMLLVMFRVRTRHMQFDLTRFGLNQQHKGHSQINLEQLNTNQVNMVYMM